MKRHACLNFLATASVAALLTVAVAATAGAQGGRQRGGGGGGFQGRGGMGRGMMGMMGGPMGSSSLLSLDPSHSSESALLRRYDVRRELLLSGDQQQKLNAQIQQNQQQFRQDMATARQDIMQQMRQGGQNPRDMSPEERQAFFQQSQQQMQAKLSKSADTGDKALEALLTPSQVARLHQLDLQWRSAMALSDSTLADKFQLEQDQRTQITPIVQDFRQKQRDAMRNAMRPPTSDANAPNNSPAPDANAGQNGAAPNNNAPNGAQQNFRGGRARLTPEQIQALMAEMPARIKAAEKDLDKVRKADNAKVMALLSPEQKQQWYGMEGKLFYFDPNTKDVVTPDNSQNGQNGQ